MMLMRKFRAKSFDGRFKVTIKKHNTQTFI